MRIGGAGERRHQWIEGFRCVESEDHDGDHAFHIWTDRPNKATGKRGVMKTIQTS